LFYFINIKYYAVFMNKCSFDFINDALNMIPSLKKITHIDMGFEWECAGELLSYSGCQYLFRMPRIKKDWWYREKRNSAWTAS